VHVDERHVVRRGDGAYDVRVLAVRVEELAPFVEPPADDRGQEDGNRPLGPDVRHEADEIPPVILGRCVAVGPILRIVVVPELNENVVPGPKCIEDGLPRAFLDEASRAPSVLRSIVDAPPVVGEEALQPLAPPRLGTLLGQLRGHRRVSHQVYGDGLGARGGGEQDEQRKNKASHASLKAPSRAGAR